VKQIHSFLFTCCLPLAIATAGSPITFDPSKTFRVELAADSPIGEASIREHAIAWHPVKRKFYLVADVVPLSKGHHPNTYDTDIHLWSSADLESWTYHGVAIEKGKPGESFDGYGVATPVAMVFRDGELLAPFSARKTKSFGRRSIGLAWSGSDPEKVPWTKSSGPISDLDGNDDDCALLTLPGDNRVHLFHRIDGPYRIVHTSSATPKQIDSWPKAVPVTPRPDDVRAQELTGMFSTNGTMRMLVIEHLHAGGMKIADLQSRTPGGPFTASDRRNRYLPTDSQPTDLAYSGMVTPVVRDGQVVAFFWCTFQKGKRYGLLGHPIVKADRSTRAVAVEPRDDWKQIERVDIDWLRDATRKQLRGCRVQGKDGVWLHTPDGVGNYRALWTRDFAYMVEYAGDLLEPEEIKASILYLLSGQRDDGCMPDRVNVAGEGIFSPGGEQNPLADHALDNGAFMAKLLCAYVDLSGDLDLPRKIEPAIRKGLDHTRRAANGLVFNPPDAPQCPYGFTDTIAKTGHLLFCSVLYYDACVRMERLCRQAECGDPVEYGDRAELIRKNLARLWNDETGMFWAADRDCKQIDIWGSALAAHLGLATEKQSGRIADYLVKHYDEIVQRGQIRHLPVGETWQRFIRNRGIKAGTYQNGAFWATPVAWVAPTIARRNSDLAVKMVQDVIADFRERGITECVNGDYHNVPEYVVSATNVYGLVKKFPAKNSKDRSNNK